jgi:hypothetical protein
MRLLVLKALFDKGLGFLLTGYDDKFAGPEETQDSYPRELVD